MIWWGLEVNRSKKSCHGDAVSLPGLRGGLVRHQLLLILAAAFLHTHDLLVSVEEDIQYPCELARVEQVGKCGRFRAEDTRAETDAHVVIVHLVLILPRDDL